MTYNVFGGTLNLTQAINLYMHTVYASFAVAARWLLLVAAYNR